MTLNFKKVWSTFEHVQMLLKNYWYLLVTQLVRRFQHQERIPVLP